MKVSTWAIATLVTGVAAANTPPVGVAPSAPPAAAAPVPVASAIVPPVVAAIPVPAVSAVAPAAVTNAPADHSGKMSQGNMVDPREVAVQVRDPFKRPDIQTLDTTPRTELEYFPTEQYRILGVMTGPRRTQAMLLSPNGKTYMVHERMKIGVRKGIVESITPERIRVREKVINVLGKEESAVTEIKVTEQRPSGG